ncbi:MAG: TlpA disulfide reductase family protein [Castellaniella sp.]
MRSRHIIMALAAVLSLLALAVGLAWWTTGLPGKTLPDIRLQTLSGAPAALHDFKGRPVVLNLWATWCGPCQREMPLLQASQAANPDIHFVFVNHKEAPDVVRNWLAAEGLQLGNVVLDREAELIHETGSRGLPTTIFLDAGIRVREMRLGELSAQSLSASLKLLRRYTGTTPDKD